MKVFFVLSVVALAVVQAEETYSTENDDLDIDAVVGDLESLKAFSGCFLDTVTCSAVAADFKKDIPEAVEQACAKCTQAQKQIFKKYLNGLKAQQPAEYEAFKKKFDPQGVHFAPLEAAVASS